MRILTSTLAISVFLAASPLYANDAPTPAPAQRATQQVQAWPLPASDIAIDPAYRLYTLPNGMKVALRENATPEGQALVRFHIDAGSLDETDSERGLAHYVEHMAFNGSTNVPEGEMVKLLEREGLAFGADTNASTGLEVTTYKLNLPRNDADLLDTALMLMRETASELIIDEGAVERERGIILAERRDRRNFSYRNLEDNLEFSTPDARYADRLPIGALEVLENATASDLRGYYERNYVPQNATLIIVGDFPVELMKRKVREHFSTWHNPALAPADPITGPVDISVKGKTDIYIDPALSENVRIWRYGPWLDRPDTAANRQAAVQRQVGYAIINRRFAKLARAQGAPFRNAGFGASDVFEDARQTSLVINSADGEWEKGLTAATLELRKAMAFGFSQSEVDEQIARIRSSLEASERASATRSNGAFVGAVMGLLNNDRIPSTPQAALERFNAYADKITPKSALLAVVDDSTPLFEPQIRFTGRTAPNGDATALRKAWQAAMKAEITAPELVETAEFGYTEFGPSGEVVSDTTDDRLGLRLVRFANGLRLNLKKTDIFENQIRFLLGVDGGDLLNTKDDPLKTALVSTMPAGGLGKHSQDELASILAGKRVSAFIGSGSDRFSIGGSTIPQDLPLQLQLLAASLTDPGYRKAGEERFGRSIDSFFANLDATPGRAISNALGGILSDGDPRFTLQTKEAYKAQSFAKLKEVITPSLESGAMEIAIVGDLDEDLTIAAVAATLGALPMRAADFEPRDNARKRSFTAKRGLRTLTHTGEPDQALIRMIWPTTDDSELSEVIRLNMLSRVVRIKLQEQLREELGQAYSPSASNSMSRTYDGYGTFTLSASVDLAMVEPARDAISKVIAELIAEPLDEDTLSRARKPALEGYDNVLKSLNGWMSLARRSQSEPERIDRYFATRDLIEAVKPADIQQAATQYLQLADVVEILVVPKEDPAQAEEGIKPSAPPIAGE